MHCTTTPAVEAIGEFVFEGNIIPHAWYKSPLLRKETGKPHLLAIHILADIMYWYRPKIDYDAEANEIKGYHKKFHADKLQKSYQSYADMLGFTKIQVKRAFDFLIERGLVNVEFRNIHRGGLAINNVLYVEPVVDRVRPLMVSEGHPYEKVNTPYQNSNGTPDDFVNNPPSKNVRTNTENTSTQNTAENTHKGEGGRGLPSAPSARRANKDNQVVQAISDWLAREVEGGFTPNSKLIRRTARALAARVSSVEEFNSFYGPEITYVCKHQISLRRVREHFGLETQPGK